MMKLIKESMITTVMMVKLAFASFEISIVADIWDPLNISNRNSTRATSQFWRFEERKQTNKLIKEKVKSKRKKNKLKQIRLGQTPTHLQANLVLL